MGYGESLLASGERITMRERQHPLAILLDGRWAFAFLVVALVLFWFGGNLSPDGVVGTGRSLLGWVTLVLFLAALALLGFKTANWLNEEYLVTNRRVMKVDGLLNKHSADSSLEKINDAVLDQNVLGRLLGYGDLDIVTANEDAVDKYKMLAHVVAFKKEMLNQKHDLEFEQMRPPVSPPLRATPAPPPPAALIPDGGLAPSPAMPPAATPPAPKPMTAAEVTQTLAGLADLRDRGAITAEEFDAKKADLLGRL